MIIEGRVQTSDNAGGEGSIQQLRLGKSGEAFVADAHGRYYDACRRLNLYAYNLTAVTALSVSSTTSTGLICYNPAVSPKAVSLIDVIISTATLPAAQFSFALVAGIQSILPTGLTLTNTAIQNLAFGKGSAATSAIATSSAATVQAVAVVREISGGGAAATTAQITPVYIRDEIAGLYTFYPGTQFSVQAVTTAVSVLMTYVGEEVPAV